MIHHWKGLDLEITDFEYHHGRTRCSEITPSKTSNLEYVEIIKFSGEPAYDTLLESSWLGDYRF